MLEVSNGFGILYEMHTVAELLNQNSLLIHDLLKRYYGIKTYS